MQEASGTRERVRPKVKPHKVAHRALAEKPDLEPVVAKVVAICHRILWLLLAPEGLQVLLLRIKCKPVSVMS